MYQQPVNVNHPWTFPNLPLSFHLAFRLRELILNSLETFNTNPVLVDDPSIASGDLWEEMFNGMFKGAPGWGTSLDVGNVSVSAT